MSTEIDSGVRLKIVSVRAYPLYASFERLFGGREKVPAAMLAPANHFRLIPRSGQHSTVVAIQSDDGLTGIGEAFGLPHSQPTASLINDVIGPPLVGQWLDAGLEHLAGQPATLLAPFYEFFVALGHTRGPSMEALSGVDIALWDLLAKRAGQPLAQYLGGSLRPIRTYVSPVPYLPTPQESADAARRFVTQGFGGIKLKVGRGVAMDMEHAEAVRDAIGPRVNLMLDANCAYTTGPAIELGKALKALNVAWLEEPIRPDSPHELAHVRRQSPVPIACGENEFMTASFEALAVAGAADFLQPNITRAGGVSGMLAVDRVCARHGVSLSPHGVGSGIGIAAAVHTVCAAKAFSVYEANLLPNALRHDLALRPMALVDGHLVPEPRPGHGCEPNWEVLASYQLDNRTAPSPP